MTAPVRKLYKEALGNNLFWEQFKTADPEGSRPNFFTSNAEKHFIVCIYEGWLIARGEFNDENYKI